MGRNRKEVKQVMDATLTQTGDVPGGRSFAVFAVEIITPGETGLVKSPREEMMLVSKIGVIAHFGDLDPNNIFLMNIVNKRLRITAHAKLGAALRGEVGGIMSLSSNIVAGHKKDPQQDALVRVIPRDL